MISYSYLSIVVFNDIKYYSKNRYFIPSQKTDCSYSNPPIIVPVFFSYLEPTTKEVSADLPYTIEEIYLF